jgi:hypothetical protein
MAQLTGDGVEVEGLRIEEQVVQVGEVEHVSEE